MELAQILQQYRLIAGVDEVGRGPLVGAVVTSAVILDPNDPIAGLNDSKKLTEKKREALAIEIKARALAWSLGRAERLEIDEINILKATMLAMQRAEMLELHDKYPHYGFADHKGYPTAKHLEALRKHGPIMEHRRSFAPVRDELGRRLSGLWLM